MYIGSTKSGKFILNHLNVHPTEILTSICLSKPDFSTDILVKIRRSLSDPAGRLPLANSYTKSC